MKWLSKSQYKKRKLEFQKFWVGHVNLPEIKDWESCKQIADSFGVNGYHEICFAEPKIIIRNELAREYYDGYKVVTEYEPKQFFGLYLEGFPSIFERDETIKNKVKAHLGENGYLSYFISGFRFRITKRGLGL